MTNLEKISKMSNEDWEKFYNSKEYQCDFCAYKDDPEKCGRKAGRPNCTDGLGKWLSMEAEA